MLKVHSRITVSFLFHNVVNIKIIRVTVTVCEI